MNLDAPVWRVVGSAASWLIFALSFTVFCLGVFGVLQVGGTCADGGAYVIAVHCPENTDIFTLGGVYGGIGAVLVSIVLARMFGTRIILAWTILFLTLSLPFLFVGAVTLPTGLPFLIGGVVFVAMAIAPVGIEARAAGLQRLFLGVTDAAGRRFREREGARASMFIPGTPNPEDAVAPTSRDWALSLGLFLIPVVVGVVGGFAAFTAA